MPLCIINQALFQMSITLRHLTSQAHSGLLLTTNNNNLIMGLRATLSIHLARFHHGPHTSTLDSNNGLGRTGCGRKLSAWFGIYMEVIDGVIFMIPRQAPKTLENGAIKPTRRVLFRHRDRLTTSQRPHLLLLRLLRLRLPTPKPHAVNIHQTAA